MNGEHSSSDDHTTRNHGNLGNAKQTSVSERADNMIHLPDVFSHLTVAEECTWRQSGIGITQSQMSAVQVDTNIGSAILKHGKTVQNIHEFFSKLESRKCCLHLTGGQTIFSNIRLVRIDDSLEEGAMKKQQQAVPNVEVLTDREYSVYRKALLCAQFPVLFLPDPPTAASPMVSSAPPLQRIHDSFNEQASGTELPSSSDSLNWTPDVDDTSSTSLIQAETLCETLRQVFGISRSRARLYSKKIYEPYGKRQAAKILVDELVQQLSLLEKNRHPFYNVQKFPSRPAYEMWRQWERRHIMELINKFWHSSLPPLQRASPGLTHDLNTHHDDYKFLLAKLIRYESSCKEEDSMFVSDFSGPLSLASLRLLKEFSLRYGIGDVFRQVVYLEYLAVHFENSVCYYNHVISKLNGLSDILPTNKTAVCMTTQELQTFLSALNILRGQCANSLIRCKRLFPGNHPRGAVSSVIELLKLVLSVKANETSQPQQPVAEYLSGYVKECCSCAYERHKLLAFSEVRVDPVATELTPRLVNRLITNIRDEVKDYRDNYHMTFKSYIDISQISANIFYDLLMADVLSLCNQNDEDSGIDLTMVSLMYRLNQLDQEWSNYVHCSKQSWRKLFLKKAELWLQTLKKETRTLTIHAVAADKFKTLRITRTESCNVTPRLPRQCPTAVSLTPSDHSAFTSVRAASRTSDDLSQDFLRSTSSQNTPTMHRKVPVRIIEEESSKVSTLPSTTTTTATVPNITGHETNLNNGSADLLSDSRPRHTACQENGASNDTTDSPKLISFKSLLRPSHSSPNLRGCVNTSNGKFEKRARFGSEICISTRRHTGDMESQVNSVEDRNKDAGISALHTENGSRNAELNGRSPCGTASDNGEENVDDYAYSDSSASSQTGRHQNENRDDNASPKLFDMFVNISTENTIAEIEQSGSPYPPVQAFPTLVGSGSYPGYNSHENLPPGSSAFTSFPGSRSESGDTPHCYLESVEEDPVLVKDLAQISTVFKGHESNNERYLRLSSSAIDVIAIAQRVTGLVKTLAQTLYPIPPPGGATSHLVFECLDDSRVKDVVLDAIAGRQSLYEKALQVLSSVLCLYADNMVCMDLCGLSESTAAKLIGKQILIDLKHRKTLKLVWGCRHMVSKQKNCFMYRHRKVKFLADKYEAVTKEMCTRINNVGVLISLVHQFHQQMAEAVDLDYITELLQEIHDESPDLNQEQDYFFLEILPQRRTPNVYSRSSSSASSSASSPSGTKSPRRDVITVIVGHLDWYLRDARRALVRLLCHRINLFFQEALSILLSVPSTAQVGKSRMKPLLEFTENHTVALALWTYRDSNQLILETLWTMVMEDFEEQVEKLKYVSEPSNQMAGLAIYTITTCLKLFHQEGRGLDLETLSVKADYVTNLLQLFTCSTSHLISLYWQLRELSWPIRPVGLMEKLPEGYLDVMRSKLHAFRKCFSGKQLVQWIRDNPPFDQSLDDSDTDKDNEDGPDKRHVMVMESEAVDLAQKLLDSGVIVSMDEAMSRPSSRSSDPDQTYPDLVILPHLDSTNSPAKVVNENNTNDNGERNDLSSQHISQADVPNTVVVAADVHIPYSSEASVENTANHSTDHGNLPTTTHVNGSNTNASMEDEVTEVKKGNLPEGSNSKENSHDVGTENVTSTNQIVIAKDKHINHKETNGHFSSNIGVDHEVAEPANRKSGYVNATASNAGVKNFTSSQSRSPPFLSESGESTRASSSHSSTFQNSDFEFYHFHNMLDVFSSHVNIEQSFSDSRSEQSEVFLSGPLQKCVDHKVSFDFIQGILFSRRKVDKLAWLTLREISRYYLEEMTILIQNECKTRCWEFF